MDMSKFNFDFKTVTNTAFRKELDEIIKEYDNHKVANTSENFNKVVLDTITASVHASTKILEEYHKQLTAYLENL